MSILKTVVCDRCGKVIIPDKGLYRLISTNKCKSLKVQKLTNLVWKDVFNYDLCAECTSKLLDFLTEYERRGDVYE